MKRFHIAILSASLFMFSSIVQAAAPTSKGELSSISVVRVLQKTSSGAEEYISFATTLEWKVSTLYGEPVLICQATWDIEEIRMELPGRGLISFRRNNSAGFSQPLSEIPKDVLDKVRVYDVMYETAILAKVDLKGNAAVFVCDPGVFEASGSGKLSYNTPGSPDWDHLFANAVTAFRQKSLLDDQSYVNEALAKSIVKQGFELNVNLEAIDGKFNLSALREYLIGERRKDTYTQRNTIIGNALTNYVRNVARRTGAITKETELKVQLIKAENRPKVAFEKLSNMLERIRDRNLPDKLFTSLEEQQTFVQEKEQTLSLVSKELAELVGDEAAAIARAEEEQSAYIAAIKSHRILIASNELPKPKIPPVVGSTSQDCPDCPEMIIVPAGNYMRGSLPGDITRKHNESPRHRVTITKPFGVSRYEITFAQWDVCVAEGDCVYRPNDGGFGGGDRPVINVSWNLAQKYLKWLSDKTGQQYRLLSGAEWEYVARAGASTRYSWGDTIGRNRANCHDCGSQWDNIKTAPVGSFAPNAFGLYDLHGNVAEWTADCDHDDYNGAPSDGIAWKHKNGGNCDRHEIRGGDWKYYSRNLRSASRFLNASTSTRDTVGFRVAKSFN